MPQSSPTVSFADGASSPRICASPPSTAPRCRTVRAPTLGCPAALAWAVSSTPAPRSAPSSTIAVGWTVIVAVEDHGAELGLRAELVAHEGLALEAPYR